MPFFDEWVKQFPERPTHDQRMSFIAALKDPEERAAAAYRWELFARPNQCPYLYNNDWDLWMIISGRAFGKSRSGAEWILWLMRRTLKIENLSKPVYAAIIGPTFSAISEIQLEGPSGIYSLLAPWEKEICAYNKSKQELVFDGKFYIRCYSAEDPEQIRGPSVHFSWVDEIAAMGSRVDAVMDQVGFITRERPPKELAPHSQTIVTSTPIFVPYLVDKFAEVNKDPRLVISTGSIHDNAQNLSETVFKSIMRHEGTAKGDVEIYGKMIDSSAHSIFKREWFKLWPKEKALPYFTHIILSLDTAYSIKKEADFSACIYFGLFEDEDDPDVWHAMVLDFYKLKLEYPDLRSKIIDDYHAYYGSENNRKKLSAMIIERKGSGYSISSDLIGGARMRKIIPFNPKNIDKRERAHAVSHVVKDGKIHLIESRKRPGNYMPYFDALMDELTAYPLSRNDDTVDCLTQFLTWAEHGGILDVQRVIEDDDEEEFYSPRQENPYG